MSGCPSADFKSAAPNAFLTCVLLCGDGSTSSPIFADANGSSPPTLTSLPGKSFPNFDRVYSSDASSYHQQLSFFSLELILVVLNE